MFVQTINATDVRKHFSEFIDMIVREKPAVIKRNRDYVFSLSMEDMCFILEQYRFSADKYIEDDGSITLSLNEIDLAVNEPTLENAVDSMAKEIKEYAEEYYENFKLYYNSSNRKKHLPYILRILTSGSIEDIRGMIDA
jgi:hypothetical protein